MSKTVFILGAGASVAAGAPVMAKFIDVAEDLLASGAISEPEAKKDFELVFKGIHSLQSVYSKSSIDSDNLEAVFVAFEMAAQLECLPGISVEDIRQLPKAFRRVIVRTLEETVRFPTERSKSGHNLGSITRLLPPPEYQYLAERARYTQDGACIISFNYDCALDAALSHIGVRTSYRLGDSPRQNGVVDVLKLHGSLNWFFNEQGNIATVRAHDALQSGTTYKTDPSNDFGHVFIRSLSPELKNAEPVIVPPTWNKGSYQEKLLPVWRAAANRLPGGRPAGCFCISSSISPARRSAHRFISAVS